MEITTATVAPKNRARGAPTPLEVEEDQKNRRSAIVKVKSKSKVEGKMQDGDGERAAQRGSHLSDRAPLERISESGPEDAASASSSAAQKAFQGVVVV